jgi:Raf kinase inhibitor-like YbhB/YbcL family protein
MGRGAVHRPACDLRETSIPVLAAGRLLPHLVVMAASRVTTVTWPASVVTIALHGALRAYARAMKRILLGLALVGCGSDNSRDGNQLDASPGAIVLTSTAFAEGGAIPAIHTCKDVNTSPPLAWTGAPGGTQSFAVVLTDLSLTPLLVHWIIFDIPITTTELPAAVENVYAPASVAEAHQVVSVHAPVVGYYGPCPPSTHTYELAVYALDAAKLPGGGAQTTRSEALASILIHALGTGKLTGMFTPP